ncbi:RNA polymerase sigma factor [Paenibacillus contaminans]|uniref:RNA polymerase subunit sigma-70 n=1 Tax=Paenibacillus contaminans TaxID=450362 RepID=A0A329M125_9BACL|nr:RNA polymerase sigma factor [Paenibacillus contaminans]RAV12966.1 RNA polymerase subunit sigma-70 [Paenibacillus contaminans]
MDLELERRLIEDIRGGSQESFRTLVNPLIAKAYRSALAILGSSPLAEEAVQNALIESYSMIMSGKEIRHFQGWFSRVIAHRALDTARKEKNYKYSLDIQQLDIRDHADSPLESMLKKEQSERLIESVMALELEQRAVVVMYYFQELKIEEIAELLGLKEGTVKSRLYYARLKLSRKLHSADLMPQTREMMI